jgi:hypothetical protein
MKSFEQIRCYIRIIDSVDAIASLNNFQSRVADRRRSLVLLIASLG